MKKRIIGMVMASAMLLGIMFVMPFPEVYAIGDTFTTISAGNEYSLAIKTDGSLWGWGSNQYAKLGLKKETISPVPVKIMDSVAFVSAYEDQMRLQEILG